MTDIPVAHLIGNRIILWDSEKGSLIYQLGYYGKPVGIRKPKSPHFNRPLEISVLEGFYLLSLEKIQIAVDRKILTKEEFRERCIKQFKYFDDLYLVYEDLRNLGYIVRPGLKFGTDFSVYYKGPGIDHAPFLVHVQHTALKPIVLVRAGRLATSVRKRYVIATVLPDRSIRYYVFSWFKP
ncbi:MAG: tRNA-intron lyase [Promethearchaeota archaeon]